MAQKIYIKLTSGIALAGQVKRPGAVVEVDEKTARQLLQRGKGELIGGQPESQSAQDPQPRDLSALTVAELRELVPDAPSRATKAELIALIEAGDAGGE